VLGGPLQVPSPIVLRRLDKKTLGGPFPPPAYPAQRTANPLRHPRRPGLSLTGVRLIIPEARTGRPVLRAALSWWYTCCRHAPCNGRAASSSSHPAVSAYPGSTSGSACTSSFSGFAQTFHTSRCGLHTVAGSPYVVTANPKASDTSSPPCLLRSLPGWSVRGWGLHHWKSAALVTAHVEFDIPLSTQVPSSGLATTARDSSSSASPLGRQPRAAINGHCLPASRRSSFSPTEEIQEKSSSL